MPNYTGGIIWRVAVFAFDTDATIEFTSLRVLMTKYLLQFDQVTGKASVNRQQLLNKLLNYLNYLTPFPVTVAILGVNVKLLFFVSLDQLPVLILFRNMELK